MYCYQIDSSVFIGKDHFSDFKATEKVILLLLNEVKADTVPIIQELDSIKNSSVLREVKGTIN